MMPTLRVVTTEGGKVVLDTATLRELESRVQGPLLRAGETGYEEARTVWNVAVDRRPALILQCAGPADVIAAKVEVVESGVRNPGYAGIFVGVPGRDRRTAGEASLPCRGLLGLGPAVLPGSAAAAKVSGAVDECHVGECLGEVADEAAVFQVVFL
jgi:hypothetical protein